MDVAALRAKQLRRGARLRIVSEEGPLPHKAERLAMEESAAAWSITTFLQIVGSPKKSVHELR